MIWIAVLLIAIMVALLMWIVVRFGQDIEKCHKVLSIIEAKAKAAKTQVELVEVEVELLEYEGAFCYERGPRVRAKEIRAYIKGRYEGLT